MLGINKTRSAGQIKALKNIIFIRVLSCYQENCKGNNAKGEDPIPAEIAAMKILQQREASDLKFVHCTSTKLELSGLKWNGVERLGTGSCLTLISMFPSHIN